MHLLGVIQGIVNLHVIGVTGNAWAWWRSECSISDKVSLNTLFALFTHCLVLCSLHLHYLEVFQWMSSQLPTCWPYKWLQHCSADTISKGLTLASSPQLMAPVFATSSKRWSMTQDEWCPQLQLIRGTHSRLPAWKCSVAEAGDHHGCILESSQEGVRRAAQHSCSETTQCTLLRKRTGRA